MVRVCGFSCCVLTWVLFGVLSAAAETHKLTPSRPAQDLAVGRRTTIGFSTTPKSLKRAFKDGIPAIALRSNPPGDFHLYFDEAEDRLGVIPSWTTAAGDYTLDIQIDSADRQDKFLAALSVAVAEPRRLRRTDVLPVILLNGFQFSCWLESGTSFGNLPSYLADRTDSAYFDNCSTPGLNPSIEQVAAEFAAMMARLTYEDGERPAAFDLVAHSMGGLVARAYLAGMFGGSRLNPPHPSRVRKLITIGTPHHGVASFLSLIPLLWKSPPSVQEIQMLPNSKFMWTLSTWNQGGDDVRGVDLLSVVGQEAIGAESDGLVSVTSAGLFATHAEDRTVVVRGCHTAALSLFCADTTPLADIASRNHPTWRIVESFLGGTDDWRTVGDPLESSYLAGGVGVTISRFDKDGAAMDMMPPLNEATLSGYPAVRGLGPSISFDGIPHGIHELYLPADHVVYTLDLTDVLGHRRFIIKPPPFIARVASRNYIGSGASLSDGSTISVTGNGLVDANGRTTLLLDGSPLSVEDASEGRLIARLPVGVQGHRQLRIQNTVGQYEIGVHILPARATITSPAAGMDLAGGTATFHWKGSAGALGYMIWAGSTPGAGDLGMSPWTTSTSYAFSNFPSDGRPVHVRLFTRIDTNEWAFEDISYRAHNQGVPRSAAELASPQTGSVLGANPVFTWTSGTGTISYRLNIGRASGTADVFSTSVNGETRSVAAFGIPTDGRMVYVRLISTFSAAAGGGSEVRDYAFVTQNIPRSTRLQVSNRLIYPVDLFVNDTWVGRANGSSSFTRDFSTNASLQLSFKLIRPALSDGTPLGDPMEGVFAAVPTPPTALSYTISNQIGNQSYFAPLITNRSASGALMMVNGGLQAENPCHCVIPAGASNAALGYYRWYSTSNVRAYPPGLFWLYVGSYLYWSPIAFEEGTGIARLTLNP